MTGDVQAVRTSSADRGYATNLDVPESPILPLLLWHLVGSPAIVPAVRPALATLRCNLIVTTLATVLAYRATVAIRSIVGKFGIVGVAPRPRSHRALERGYVLITFSGSAFSPGRSRPAAEAWVVNTLYLLP